MNADLLFDPLFAEPFITGLVFAILLPLLGCYLRLRDEWLAALAFAQTAAAGSLLAMLFGLPLALGGLAAAGLAATLKHAFEGATRGTQGAAYAMLLLLGWGISVLLVANLPLAERMGHALFDGQLYFTERSHLVSAGGFALLSFFTLRWLSRRLLLAHFFPDFFRARGLSERRAHFVFDLLVAGALALATMSVGVMGAFALIFVPPLIAFNWGNGWHGALLLALSSAFLAYVAAFALALVLDQPFGPLLGLLLVATGVCSALLRSLMGRD
ncbi:metal ABC transporter permease [Propionivibrio sp.]|uniref:metal ABC transporter permease n=1 Tax=Propionivibrio sp. TaxID=2212460 RepID=UPI003BEF7AD5